MTTRADIMNTISQEEAFTLINAMDWTQKRKNAEKSLWRRKHMPDSVKKNPAKGNRNQMLKGAVLLDKPLEEIKKLKDEHEKKYTTMKEDLLVKINKYKEQIEKWETQVVELNKKLNTV